LNYEFHIRKKMYKNMNDLNMTLADALKAARKDSEIRDQYFLVPFSMQAPSAKRGRPNDGLAADAPAPSGQGVSKRARKRAAQKAKASPPAPPPPPPSAKGSGRWVQNPGGKGKGKKGKDSKGKGKGKQQGTAITWYMNGMKKCFKFQRDQCPGKVEPDTHIGPCGMLHVCLWCGEPHKTVDCETCPPELKTQHQ
jgi:hypothetical protein